MFSLVNLSDGRAIVPVALVALASAGAWYLWTRAKRNAAEADAAATSASANAAPNTGSLANLALVSALFGGSSPAQGNTGQVTYTAPTGSNATPALPTPAPVGAGSSTGNTAVSQGV